MTLTLTIQIGDGPVHDIPIQVPVSIEAIEAINLPPQDMPVTLIGWSVGGIGGTK